LGGDEFVILLIHLAGVPSAKVALVAQRIIEEFCKPFLLDGKDYGIIGSLGIALADTVTKSTDRASLLRNADVAMCCAKAGGKGAHRYGVVCRDRS
jgi:GGDEF domain-containing protein